MDRTNVTLSLLLEFGLSGSGARLSVAVTCAGCANLTTSHLEDKSLSHTPPDLQLDLGAKLISRRPLSNPLLRGAGLVSHKQRLWANQSAACTNSLLSREGTTNRHSKGRPVHSEWLNILTNKVFN